MTDSSRPDPQESPRASANEPQALLARALGRARFALFWEQFWPLAAGFATLAGAFVAASWLGLWVSLGPWARLTALVPFVLAVVWLVLRALGLRLPGHGAALTRVDRESGISHRPATAIADRLAAESADPFTRALWQAHHARAQDNAARLRAGAPAPGIVRFDRYALRALVLLLLCVSFFTADGERWQRLRAAFAFGEVMPGANMRLDAWLSPPAYTGRPPVILPTQRQAAEAEGPIATPRGTLLVVRVSGTDALDIEVSGDIGDAPPDARAAAPAAVAGGAVERRLLISGDGQASIRARGVRWTFRASADQPPGIDFVKDPEKQGRGALQLSYRVEDDYGVLDARAAFALKGVAGDARPLFEAPDMPLLLPQARARRGTAQTTKDLTEHPWAGAEVGITLSARDEAGQSAASMPRDFRLPERMFVKPLARALVEQRRVLALDANQRGKVLLTLDALAIAPDKFTPESGQYLGLRSVYHQLIRARSDDALREVVASLWNLALSIEDGSSTDAERALREAQEALRQAIERGASEEEIRRLMDQLRAAMDRFMQQLAEQMRKNPQQLARPLDQNTRVMRPRDLQNMLDRLEKLARSGDKDAARQLLEQLAQMMQNLQMAQPGMSGGDDDMAALDELGDMIREQQQLRDRTFRQGRDGQQGQQGQQNQRGQRGQRGQQGQGQEGQQGGEGLQQQQQALRDRLNKLLDELRKRGLGQQGQQGQGQQGQQGQGGENSMDELGRAGDAMGDAEGQLGQNDSEGAVDSQGRALESLRRGAQNLAQSMQQQMGEGQGQGQGNTNGRRPGDRADQTTDPLGRPVRGRDYGDDNTVKVPGEIDVQRARRILEELRRRLAEPSRPQLELDYLERLLKDF